MYMSSLVCFVQNSSAVHVACMTNPTAHALLHVFIIPVMLSLWTTDIQSVQ